MPLSFSTQHDESTWLARLIATCDAVSARGRNHAIDMDVARDFEAQFLNPRGSGNSFRHAR